MMFTRPDDDTLHQALLCREVGYEGSAFVCVTRQPLAQAVAASPWAANLGDHCRIASDPLINYIPNIHWTNADLCDRLPPAKGQ
jgi:hypothetical protein